jgi:3-oxoacyl-[acyl-carrier protein] reductase
MIGGNAYVTGKAALEAHSVNLAAELAGTGVTVNVYRPGMVDTAMQTWIRDQDGRDIPELHERFHRMYNEGLLISPEQSAAALVPRIAGTETGQIWNPDDPVTAATT